jgi:hypothetical protein
MRRGHAHVGGERIGAVLGGGSHEQLRTRLGGAHVAHRSAESLALVDVAKRVVDGAVGHRLRRQLEGGLDAQATL